MINETEAIAEERGVTSWRPEPGVYRGIPAAQYHSCPYFSNSRSRLLVPPSTPAHLKAELDEPPKDKKVWKEGRALHACVLEPERYAAEYRVAEQCIATTKKGERCSKGGTVAVHGGGEVCSTHAGDFQRDDEVLLVSSTDDAMARACREALRSHEIAGGFLVTPDAELELTIIWRCPVTGVMCKARVDWYSPTMFDGLPMDLKGARDASEYEFAKQAHYNGYLRQSVLYRMGLNAVGLPAEMFASVAQEKTKPFELMVYMLGDEATGPLPRPGEEPQHVARLLFGLMRLWDRCHRTNTWPGYPRAVHTMTTPDWAWADIDRQTAALEMALATEVAA